MRKILILTIAVLAHSGNAQVAVSYFPFQSQLSISTNPENLLWGDFRMETNTFVSNMNMELGPVLSLKRTKVTTGYLGAGLNFNAAYIATPLLNVLNGYFLTAGVRIKPFEKSRSVHLVFEISPYVNSALKGGNLRTRLGLGYNFLRNKSATQQTSPEK